MVKSIIFGLLTSSTKYFFQASELVSNNLQPGTFSINSLENKLLVFSSESYKGIFTFLQKASNCFELTTLIISFYIKLSENYEIRKILKIIVITKKKVFL